VVTAEDILLFWFGELGDDGRVDESHAGRFWTKDAAFDREVTSRFGATYDAIMRDERESWLESARGRLAYVIVLDQFARNMFRGSARSFQGDARALEAARVGVERGHDRELRGDERVFLYMPFMHSESLADQERCIELFRAFRDETSGKLRETLDNNLQFAIRHRDIIQQWGRFPHRNAVLGRASTPEELAFLQQPNSSF
jgi:uncharacterized protein (DUF924 family)